MALAQSIPDPYGAPDDTIAAAYWRADTLDLRPVEKLIVVGFRCYRSAEARVAGVEAMPDVRRSYAIRDADYDAMFASANPPLPTIGAALFAAVYGFAKGQPEFAGATDA